MMSQNNRTDRFPWSCNSLPLMLAPMQGLTNKGLRELFATWVQPDTLFTEFMRVAGGESRKPLSPSDLNEIGSDEGVIPLVVQLIGHSTESLVAAARTAENAGAAHINLNLGCPFGRMNSGLTGGGILQRADLLHELIPAMRNAIKGTFSVKLRAGYDNPEQIFSLLSLFESAKVDFLILHPRTVLQEYEGTANHLITARVVKESALPVIANGDVRTAEQGLRLLEQTGAAGLMLGRGAIADPLLFQRIRRGIIALPERSEKMAMLKHYLTELLTRYQGIFCGEQQILGKVKAVFSTMDEPEFERVIKKLVKTRTVREFILLKDAIL